MPSHATHPPRPAESDTSLRRPATVCPCCRPADPVSSPRPTTRNLFQPFHGPTVLTVAAPTRPSDSGPALTSRQTCPAPYPTDPSLPLPDKPNLSWPPTGLSRPLPMTGQHMPCLALDYPPPGRTDSPT